MADETLVAYLQQAKAAGMSDEQIKQELVAAGWQESVINENFAVLNPDAASQARANFSLGKKGILGLAALGILILGGGGAAYYYYINYPSPQQLMRAYLVAAERIKTMDFDVRVDAELSGAGTEALAELGGNVETTAAGEPIKYSLSYRGAFDGTDSENEKLDGTFELTIFDFAPKIDLRLIKETLYLRFSNLPDLGMMDFGQFADQWIRIDNLTQLANNSAAIVPTASQLSDEQIAQLEEIWTLDRLIKMTERLLQEKINGITTHHLRFALDMTAVREAAIASLKVIRPDAPELTTEEREQLDKIFGAIEVKNLEVWFGKKDNLIHRLALEINFDAAKIDDPNLPETIAINTKFNLNLSGYNTPKNITAPENSKTWEEITTGAIDPSPTPTPVSSPSSVAPEATPSSDLWFGLRGLIYSVFFRSQEH